MSIDEQGREKPHEAADHLKRIEKHLAEEDQQFEQLAEEIREAERKGKVVDPDPEP